jgi:hypothetical protein
LGFVDKFRGENDEILGALWAFAVQNGIL